MIGRIVRRVRTLINRGQVNDEIKRELEFHIDMEADARARRGLSPAEATSRACGQPAARSAFRSRN